VGRADGGQADGAELTVSRPVGSVIADQADFGRRGEQCRPAASRAAGRSRRVDGGPRRAEASRQWRGGRVEAAARLSAPRSSASFHESLSSLPPPPPLPPYPLLPSIPSLHHASLGGYMCGSRVVGCGVCRSPCEHPACARVGRVGRCSVILLMILCGDGGPLWLRHRDTVIAGREVIIY